MDPIHAQQALLQRRASLRPTRPSAHELTLEERLTRSVTSINVRREDREVFRGLKGLWTEERGRFVADWDAFTYLLADAQDNPRSLAYLGRR